MAATALVVESLPLSQIPSLINGLPNICGWEADVQSVVQSDAPVALPYTNIKLQHVSAAFAIALHMHQPTIPAGTNAELISNLQYMFEHPYDGDNHNAGPFSYCYSRMADFIPDLINQGCNPRIMLDYSGNLLWGLEQMGRHDILDNLRRITSDSAYYPYVEWLGTMWSHAVVPSTPIRDLKLHVQAWQHHFASLFGWEALARVKGFSLPEMHLPNHPDTLYEFITVLKAAGYRWFLAQEHTLESLTGEAIGSPHLPHQIVAHNSRGQTVTMTVLIKTQGSDTKLVGQMQPYYEAKSCSAHTLGGREIPPLVSQISDGENGGVMMNEFPGMFRNAWYEIRDQSSSSGVVGLNGTEYLELLAAEGITSDDYPKCQAKGQALLWQHIDPDTVTPESLAEAIATTTEQNSNFSMDGGSWTNHISWEQGYENVTSPMHSLSQTFDNVIGRTTQSHPDPQALRREHRYRNALLHNMLLQTSCFRYWGQGTWTDYAQELYRRGDAILRYDF